MNQSFPEFLIFTVAAVLFLGVATNMITTSIQVRTKNRPLLNGVVIVVMIAAAIGLYCAYAKWALVRLTLIAYFFPSSLIIATWWMVQSHFMSLRTKAARVDAAESAATKADADSKIAVAKADADSKAAVAKADIEAAHIIEMEIKKVTAASKVAADKAAQEQLEADRVALVEQGRKKAENEIRAEIEALEHAALASWTPDAVGAHVGGGITGIALFAVDHKLGKPVLWIELSSHSIARIPCDVLVEIVECSLHSLPVPGKTICELEGKKIEAPFDGTLRPDTIGCRKSVKLTLPDGVIAEIRALSIPSLWCMIRLQISYRLDGKVYKKPLGEPMQRDLSFPPEWSKQP